MLTPESSAIKEEKQVVERVIKAKKTRRLRQSIADISTIKVNTSMQADMLNKLQRMKEKLNKKNCKGMS